MKQKVLDGQAVYREINTSEQMSFLRTMESMGLLRLYNLPRKGYKFFNLHRLTVSDLNSRYIPRYTEWASEVDWEMYLQDVTAVFEDYFVSALSEAWNSFVGKSWSVPEDAYDPRVRYGTSGLLAYGQNSARKSFKREDVNVMDDFWSQIFTSDFPWMSLPEQEEIPQVSVEHLKNMKKDLREETALAMLQEIYDIYPPFTMLDLTKNSGYPHCSKQDMYYMATNLRSDFNDFSDKHIVVGGRQQGGTVDDSKGFKEVKLRNRTIYMSTVPVKSQGSMFTYGTKFMYELHGSGIPDCPYYIPKESVDVQIMRDLKRFEHATALDWSHHDQNYDFPILKFVKSTMDDHIQQDHMKNYNNVWDMLFNPKLVLNALYFILGRPGAYSGNPFIPMIETGYNRRLWHTDPILSPYIRKLWIQLDDTLLFTDEPVDHLLPMSEEHHRVNNGFEFNANKSWSLDEHDLVDFLKVMYGRLIRGSDEIVCMGDPRKKIKYQKDKERITYGTNTSILWDETKVDIKYYKIEAKASSIPVQANRFLDNINSFGPNTPRVFLDVMLKHLAKTKIFHWIMTNLDALIIVRRAEHNYDMQWLINYLKAYGTSFI